MFPIIWSIIALLLAPSGSDNLHAIHLSKGEVNYNIDHQSLEISLHIFRDDLELAIEQAGIQNPHLTSVKEHEKADSLIALYLESSFNILINNQKVDFSFLGKEDSADLLAVWCYLEGENIAEIKELKLINKILLNIYDDQKNIIAFTGPGQKKVMLFDNKKSEATIVFQ